VSGLRFDGLDAEVRHCARRHLLDTVGVMVSGAAGDVATTAEAMLMAVRGGGAIPVPGGSAAPICLMRLSSAARQPMGSNSMTATGKARCIQAAPSFQPCWRLAARRVRAAERSLKPWSRATRTVIAIARVCHPDLRQRGFHPTGACGVFGAAAAVARLRGLPAPRIANAIGIAASGAAGLFAFVNGGADIKRLHAGHAAREGVQAALLAAAGVQGPPGVIESRDGFLQAFAFGRTDPMRPLVRPLALPPAVPFGITDCYVKPYACCRHLQPAVEALMGLCREEDIVPDEVIRIDVDTYRIAASTTIRAGMTSPAHS